MMNEAMIERLLDAAGKAGLGAAEVYSAERDSFRAIAATGSLDAYSVSTTGGMGLRGVWQGKLGYAATETLAEEDIPQLIEAVKESAEVNEATDQAEIFPGEEAYPDWTAPESDIAEISAEEKLQAVTKLDRAIRDADSRISEVQRAGISTVQVRMTLTNTYGLRLSQRDSFGFAMGMGIAKRGDGMVNGGDIEVGRMFRRLDLDDLAKRVAEDTVFQLEAAPVPSGEYHVILERHAMVDLLGTFCGMFSAERAQQGLSLLKGRENSVIASPVVTLIDDPLLPEGFASGPFDAEGSASRRKSVVENGTLCTLLHSRKTAKKQGVATTGNASRGGYASAIHVSPTNFFFKPGEMTLEAMMADIGSGLVITEVSGLHAGANPISGDFSLLSKGYTIEGGRKGRAVEQITVAGNFYRLLENAVRFGSDLYFPGSGVGAPSLDAGMMSVAGA